MREHIAEYDNYLVCLVVGSRSVNDYTFVKGMLDHILSANTRVVIVSGGAGGADALAKRYAEEKGHPYLEFKADWSKGRVAGYLRNKEMHEYIAQYPYRYVVAFWDGESKGTRHSFDLANTCNNPLQIVRTDYRDIQQVLI